MILPLKIPVPKWFHTLWKKSLNFLWKKSLPSKIESKTKVKISIAQQLKEISETKSKKEKIAKLHACSTPQLKSILDYTFHPGIVWLLPKGPIQYEPSTDLRSSMIYRLQQETRKLPTFLNFGPYPNMDAKKRLALFIDVLESIHPDDAELLISIKDKKLPYPNITKELIAEAFPIFSAKWNLKEDVKI